jgi:hypothetical protein
VLVGKHCTKFGRLQHHLLQVFTYQGRSYEVVIPGKRLTGCRSKRQRQQWLWAA